MKNGSQNKVNQDRICLNSKNVSENIYKNIKDLFRKNLIIFLPLHKSYQCSIIEQ